MFTTKNIGKSFKFSFEGDDWFSKYIISGLLFLSGFGIFAINGNGLQVVRTMVEKDSEDLEPVEWNNLGENFLDGLKLCIVLFLWKLPLIIVRTFIFIITTIIFITSVNNESGAGMAVFFGLWTISCLLSGVYNLALSGFIPVIVGEVATHQSIKNGLAIKKIFHLTKEAYWRNFGISLLSGLMFFLTFMAGSQLLPIGTIITMPLAYNTKYHLFGQSYLLTHKLKMEEEKETKKAEVKPKKSASAKK